MKINDIQNAVVVPFDFSEMSIKALEHAVSLVDPNLIRVVHVTEYPSAYEYGVVWQTLSAEVIEKRIHDSWQKAFEDKLAVKDIPLTVLFGSPANEICRFAEEQFADLVLMPSHGRSGVKRYFLGSVAERVLRGSNRPVLILRGEECDEESKSSATLSSASV